MDADSGRGVPLVELETVNHLTFVTDSNGIAAIDEPGLLGQRVFFHVRSHGYEYPPDGFGYRGFRAMLEPGGSTQIPLRRINIAERLYRVTGQGRYRDSLLVGAPCPIRNAVANAGVLGQDSVVNAIYRGKLYWFWGDTNRASYPLGNFEVTGATSTLPGAGGVAASRGVDLDYFVGEDGFARPMCPIDGPGPVWIFGLMVVRDDGEERLLCHYARIKTLGVRHEHGIAIWNDDAERFEKRVEFPLDAPLYPSGNPTRVWQGDEEWFYFPNPYPMVRVRARLQDILDPTRYQSLTCLRDGARWDARQPALDRRDGMLVWRWRADTSEVTPRRWKELEHRGAVRTDEGWSGLYDIESGAPIVGHGGTVTWNAQRERWVMIALEAFGRSPLGEVWFAEADTLVGPWGPARRIVTHDRYSFYNVKQHPYFDDGRWIHFEGTYTAMFSGNDRKTPRYDYNQILYRLDLDDERLELPVPVYEVEVDGTAELLTAPAIRARGLWSKVRRVPFWAVEDGDSFRMLPDDSTAANTIRYRGQGVEGRVWRSAASNPPLLPAARTTRE